MKNSGWNAADTTWVTFEDVEVPVDHLLGQENAGFQILMTSRSSLAIARSYAYLFRLQCGTIQYGCSNEHTGPHLP